MVGEPDSALDAVWKEHGTNLSNWICGDLEVVCGTHIPFHRGILKHF